VASRTLAINRIHALDCLENLGRLPRPADVIVTSPPYNLDKPYGGYRDDRPRDEYLDWMEAVAKASRDALSDDGSFFLNVGGSPSEPWNAIDVALRFRKHLVLQNQILWVKSIAIPKEDAGAYPNLLGDVAVGHYQPVNSRAFLNGCFEPIYHFTKSGKVPLDKLAIGVPYQDKSNVARWKSACADRRDRGNTWFIPYETIQESRPHPAVFPVKLAEMCLRLHGVERAKLVVDPFAGIGSTAVAAKRLGVPFLGFEIDPVYVREAMARLEEATARPTPGGRRPRTRASS
jgi:site-specific DNA-methyltransferase (adenine-specific)